jgi:hypothetical protein
MIRQLLAWFRKLIFGAGCTRPKNQFEAKLEEQIALHHQTTRHDSKQFNLENTHFK